MSLAAVATIAVTATALATAATTFSCNSYYFAVVEVSLSALYFLALQQATIAAGSLAVLASATAAIS